MTVVMQDACLPRLSDQAFACRKAGCWCQLVWRGDDGTSCRMTLEDLIDWERDEQASGEVELLVDGDE